MDLYKYKNYAEYVESQNTAFHLKHSRNWVTDIELGIIADYIIQKYGTPKFVICHGARNGYEVLSLGGFFGRDTTIIGTDIGEWAEKIEYMIRHDFHDMREEWRDKVDLIYSNSLDHAWDPELAIKTWLSCLTKDGLLLVHWANSHKKGNAKSVDCFIATWDEYNEMLGRLGTVVEWKPISILKCGGIFIVIRRIYD